MPVPALYARLLDHPVLRWEEARERARDMSEPQLRNHVALLLKRGYLGLVRRGVYFVIPVGRSTGEVEVDRLLVGSRLVPGAVLAYRSALELHGLAQTLTNEVTFLSSRPVPPVDFRGVSYRRVAVPAGLVRRRKASFLVEEVERAGLQVRVTSRERTLVDAIHRMDLCGGLEEAVHALRACPSIDPGAVIRYCGALGIAAVRAKAGFLLERFGGPAGVTPRSMEPLRRGLPKFIPYLDPDRKGGRYVPRWNLIVPEWLAPEEADQGAPPAPIQGEGPAPKP